MVRGVLKIIPRYGFASAWSELRQTPLHCASLRLSLYEQWSMLVCQWPVLFEKPSISIRPILDLYRFEEYIIAIRVNDILGGASCKGSLILNACNGWQTWSTAVTSMG